MGANYSFARYRQLRSHVTHFNLAPLGENARISAPNSPPVSALRALFFPHVASAWDPASANPPAPGWWESAQVTMTWGLSPDGTDPTSLDDLGEADPPFVDLGYVKLTPHLYQRGVALPQYTCVWTSDSREIEFETGRRIDDVSLSPAVYASIWCIDSFGVFLNPGGFINVTHSLVNYGSILWNNPT